MSVLWLDQHTIHLEGNPKVRPLESFWPQAGKPKPPRVVNYSPHVQGWAFDCTKEMFTGPLMDHFFDHVKRSLNQLSVEDASRILLALVADHPSRNQIAARFLDWEELMHDSDMRLGEIFNKTAHGSQDSLNRKEGEELLRNFVRSVISEVWKP